MHPVHQVAPEVPTPSRSSARRRSGLPVFLRSHFGAQHMIRKVRERRHLALLMALVVAAVVEPLSVDFSAGTQIIGGIVVVTITLGVFLIVFERRWERRLAFVMVAFILGGNIGHEALP